jgi:tRNA(Ile)-lysidine synthase
MFEVFMHTLTGPCSVRQGDSVLVCVSGGIDSMVLMDLMQRASRLLHLKIGVVHVDHGIREADSADDARFVLERCGELSLQSYLKKLDMSPFTPNLEEEARHRRYEAILDCKLSGGYDFAATGHTRDDQAETILYRIIRGTGIRGLAGMTYARTDGLIRPMLDISRRQVEDFARREGIRHVLDKTNSDPKHSRNLIRHSIIPVMERINPRAVNAVARLGEIARDEDGLLEEMAGQLERNARLFDWGIIKGFAADLLRNAPGTIVRRFIIKVMTGMTGEPRGIDSLQVDAILGALNGKCAGHTVKRKVRAQIDGPAFVFSKALKGPFYYIPVNSTGSFPIPEIGMEVRVSFPLKAGRGLMIRSPLRGDRIRGKKVSEVLSGMGVMSSLRPFWPVLASNEDILAVASRDEKNRPSKMVVE